MYRTRTRYRYADLALVSTFCLIASPAFAGEDWLIYNNETPTRLISESSVGSGDTQEKDYAWADLDQNGWIDLVSVRKQPVTTAGGRRNVLFMNENGVLVDRTDPYAMGLLDQTNDRDVVIVDVNNDGWEDIITAAACNNCNAGGTTDDSRLYLNLGEDGGGNWLGFDTPIVLFGGGNNFCAVAAGDTDNDGWVDLYFVSYNDNFEDQHLVNEGEDGGGNWQGFANGNNRLTSAMLSSGFGTAAHIVDMDNDGDNDIVKSQNGPVEIFRNAGPGNLGVFDLLDPTYGGAAYHVGVGYLDGNGLLDLVISDDQTDRYILNPVLDGSGDTSFTFPGSTGGFGSDSLVIDLDGDGFNEVLIADVDVDVLTCNNEVADILRASSGPSYTADTANIPSNLLNGVHDFAVFDINNDGALDMVIGRCNGTQVWMNASVAISANFTYPDGLPDFYPPQETTEFVVQIDPIGDTIEPGTPSIFVSANKGGFVETALVALGGNEYTATLPAGSCPDRFDFYISAELSEGLVFHDPASAPAGFYTAFSADGIVNIFNDEIEGDVSGWTITSDGSLTGGEWEQADPNGTQSGQEQPAPDQDNTVDGTLAFVTENGPDGNPDASAFDVDGGATTLISPPFDLSGTDGVVSYARWAFSRFDDHDVLRIEISNDGGDNWTHVEDVADTESSWQPAAFFVSDFVVPTDQIQLRFTASDFDLSLTEAGIDDVSVDAFSCISACTGDIDGDGTVGINDFLALLAAWGPNPGHPADLDGDDIVGITDFLALLAAWGPCP